MINDFIGICIGQEPEIGVNAIETEIWSMREGNISL